MRRSAAPSQLQKSGFTPPLKKTCLLDLTKQQKSKYLLKSVKIELQ